MPSFSQAYVLRGKDNDVRAIRIEVQPNGTAWFVFGSGKLAEPVAELVRKYGIRETARLALTMTRYERIVEERDPAKAKAILDRWHQRNKAFHWYREEGGVHAQS